ncbi:MAG: hypothetical protein JW724_02350 [Candidatus Altiarchaeota archaeon]|nr:hypothetical protein [Candidatus Altiarchaeota archaeon]
MDYQKLTKEELSNLIVEKHKNFLSEYRKEFDILERLSVLKEKQDQLEHWVRDSRENPPQNQKYLQAMKAADKEFSGLKAELKSLYECNPAININNFENDSKNRYKWLRNQITTHEEALNYWTERTCELIREKEKAGKEEKDKKAPDSNKKPKKTRKTKKADKPVKTKKKK